MAMKCKACGALGAKRIGQVPGFQGWHWFGACANYDCIQTVRVMIAERMKTHAEAAKHDPWRARN